MPALQVKDCPAPVYEALRQCADRENRSISQQTLTIIERYLGMRDVPTPAAVTTEPINYGERRERVFERIRQMRPIPVSENCPSTVELIRQIREEEAR